ncbi:MAG: FAD binding domain-containing protein, partial [Pseudolabrys sp.]|nr:FAD binding domain-containing protein [Pseudolabrys sp.]
MTPFELLEPGSLKDAIALIDPDDPTVRPIAGGTALMLMMKAGVFAPSRLISLGKLGDELNRIEAKNGALTIGAMTTLSAVEHSPEVARHAAAIPRTMKRLSNVRVRNVATVGGNLAHGDPHMDLPPVLIALGASVRIAGAAGSRELKVEDLLTGYYETALEPGELIAALTIPAQGTARAAYMKVTTGSADDWPALGVAVSLDIDGAIVKSARVVVSAATPRAVRLPGPESVLAGKAIDDKLLKAA